MRNKKIELKKCIFVITIFIFIVILLLVVGLLIALIIMSCDPKYSDTPKNLISGITSTFTCLIASVSLIVTVLIKHSSDKDKEKDIRVNTDYFWFKTIVLDKYLNDIFAFHDFCSSLLDKHKSLKESSHDLSHEEYLQKIKKDIIEPFTKEYIRLEEGLIQSTSIIDEEVSKFLMDQFQKFQDEFTDAVNSNAPNYDQVKKRVNQQQTIIIKYLKDYNLSILC